MSGNLKRLIRTSRRGDLIITPRLEEWLLKNDGVLLLPGEAKDWLLPLVTARPRERSGGFSASSRGVCLRAQCFQFIGLPVRRGYDPRLQNLFNDGSWRHLRWQMMLRLAHIIDMTEVTVNHFEFMMQGTIDGVGVWEEQLFGFELKGIHSLSILDRQGGPYPKHLLQIHSYFLAKPELTKFALVYEDKATQEWREFVITPDPKLMTQVRRELLHLNRARKHATLPEVLEECRGGKGQTFRGCPYSSECLGCATWREAINIAIPPAPKQAPSTLPPSKQGGKSRILASRVGHDERDLVGKGGTAS